MKSKYGNVHVKMIVSKYNSETIVAGCVLLARIAFINVIIESYIVFNIIYIIILKQSY